MTKWREPVLRSKPKEVWLTPEDEELIRKIGEMVGETSPTRIIRYCLRHTMRSLQKELLKKILEGGD